MARPRETTRNIDNTQLSNSNAKGGVISGIAKAGASMAAFTVGIGIYKMATGKVNSGLGGLVRGLKESGGLSRLAKIAPTKKVGAFVDDIGRAIAKVPANKSRNLTTLLKNTDRVSGSRVGKFMTRMDTLENKALYNTKAYQKVKMNPIYGRAKPGFKMGEAGQTSALKARAWRQAKQVAPTMPLFYATHRVTTRGDTTRGAWYNPKEIVKWGTSFAAQTVGFGAAGVGLKALGKSPMTQRLIDGFATRHGKAVNSMVDRSLGFMKKHQGKRPLALMQAMQETRATVHPSASKNPVTFMRKVLQGASTLRKSYHSNKARLGDVKSQGVYEHAYQQTKQFAKGGGGKSFAKRIIAEEAAKQKPGKIMSGLNRLMGGDRLRHAQFSTKKHGLVNKGPGIVTKDGKEFDVQAYLPKNIMKTALMSARQVRAFGHSPIDLMNIGSFAEHHMAAKSSYTIGGGENITINLGHSYRRPLLSEGNLLDDQQSQIGSMVKGIGRNSQLDRVRLGDQLVGTRASANNLTDLNPATSMKTAKLQSAMAAGAEHGEFVIGKNQKVHSILGRLILESESGTKKSPNYYELGINTKTGNAMRYRSLPTKSGGVFSRVHDNYMGSQTLQFDDGSNQKVGFGGSKLAELDPDAHLGRSAMHKMRSKYDIGGKDSPTVFGRIHNWFKSFKDPTEPRVLLSKESLSDEGMMSFIHGARNPNDITKLGKTAAKALEKTRLYSYAKVFHDSEQVNKVNDFLKKKGVTGLLNPDEMRNLKESQLQELYGNVLGTNPYTSAGSREFRAAANVLGDLSQGIQNRSIFETSRKIGKISISYMDEWNSVIMGDALKKMSAEEIGQFGKIVGGQNTSQWLRSLQSTSSGGGSTFSTLFDNVRASNTPGKRKDLFRLMNIAKENQAAVDETLKHTRPLYKMGSFGNAGLYESGKASGNRYRLFIPEKMDVKGMPVNDGLLQSFAPNLDESGFPKNTLTMGGVATGAAVDSINSVANAIGIGFSAENSRTIGMFAKNMLTKRMLPLAGAMAAWGAADAITDESGVFDDTALGEGLNVFMASQLMKARLASARVLDSTGLTYLAKKAEDVLPGSINSPLAGAVRGVGAPLAGAKVGMMVMGPAGGLIGGAIGGAISLLTAGGPLASTGGYDITKSRKELIEEYSGRSKVAYKTDRNWILGSTPMSGTQVKGFVPNWYARMRSGYRHTPTLYGSKMERLMAPLDPGHYAEKHENTRPYPSTGGAFSNMPMVGNLMSWGHKTMHEDELSALSNLPQSTEGSVYGGGNTNFESLNSSANYAYDQRDAQFIGDSYTARKASPVGAGSATSRMGESFYRGTEIAGLRGFIGQTMMDRATDSNIPFADIPVMADSSNMTSKGRFYWEQGLGDMLGTCLAGDSKVFTRNGTINIADIKIGDVVLSTDGEYKTVTDKRKFTYDEYTKLGHSVYKLKFGTIGYNLIATENHWIPVWKRPRYKHGHSKPFNTKDITLVDTQVKDIDPGDYVGYPIIPTTEHFPNIKFDNTYTGVIYGEYIYPSITSIDYAKCHDLVYDSELKDISREYLKDHGIPAKIISYYLRNKRTCKTNATRYKHTVSVDKDLAFVFGWYLAEGSIDVGRITFTLNKNELNIAERIANIITEKIGPCKIQIKRKYNAIDLRIYCRPLAEYITKTFGVGSHNKFIPHEYKTAHSSIRKTLIRALWEGDGWWNTRIGKAGFTSVSTRLTNDLYDILLQFNIVASKNIGYMEKPNGFYPQGSKRKLTRRNYLQLNSSRALKLFELFDIEHNLTISKNSTKSFIYNNVLYISIMKLEPIPEYRESVYDITVADHHTFVANGILVHNSEFIRRMYPVQNYDVDRFNPLPNMMPGWLPEQYRTGDAYSRLKLGEVRLPGAGYESANDVELTFPGDVSVIGGSVEETASNYLFGSRETAAEAEMNRRTKAQIAQSLGQMNGAAKIDQSFFDPRLNLSGKADVYSNGTAYKIKTLNSKQFNSINQITPDMEAQLSVLGGLAKGATGSAIYVNAETGETKEYSVAPNRDKFVQGIQMLANAREQAKGLINNPNIEANFNLANAYSRMDRLKILSDVAPNSQQFYETFEQVQGSNKYQYTENYETDLENIQKMHFIRQQPKELYPYRFSKVNKDTLEGQAQWNKVKSEYGVVSRTIGGAWEKVAHAHTAINRKFMDINSPYEAYDRTQVHGKEIKLWQNPYQHFIRPYASSMATNDSASENMMSAATGGAIFGGPVGMAVGAAAGGVGALYNKVRYTDRRVPGWRKRQRNIEATLDNVEYEKAMQQYQMTGDEQYLRSAQSTMKYFNENMNTLDINDMKRAAPFAEKKYLLPMLKTQNQEERASIMAAVPDALKPGIDKYWNKTNANQTEYLNNQAKEQIDNLSPDWAGYLPNQRMDLIKTKIMKNEGLDARDSGVGWHSHISDMNRTALLPDSFETKLVNKVDTSGIKRSLEGALSSLGRATVSVVQTMVDGVSVNLTVSQG